MTLQQLLEAMAVDSMEKYFEGASPERMQKIKKEFADKKGNLDKRGAIVLTIDKKEKLDDKQFNALTYIIKSLSGKTIQNISMSSLPSYNEVKKLYQKEKGSEEEKKKEEPLTKIKSKDMGQEVLFFPNTYEQMKAFSNWMAGKDPEVSVNHWCVASSDANSFKRYAENGGKFIIIVKKDESGKPNWKERYLYYSKPALEDMFGERNESGYEDELADKKNIHYHERKEYNDIFSSPTLKFMKGFFIRGIKRDKKNEIIPVLRADEKIEKTNAKYLYNNGTFIIKADEKYLEKKLNSTLSYLDRNNIEHLDKFIVENNKDYIRADKTSSSVKTIDEISIYGGLRYFSLNDIFPYLQSVKKLTIVKEFPGSSLLPEVFHSCFNLTEVGEVVFPKMVGGDHLPGLFNSCRSLRKAPKMDLSNTVLLENLFQGCHKITTLPPYNVSKVRTLSDKTFLMNSLRKLDMSDPNAWKFPDFEKGFIFTFFKHCPLDEGTKEELRKRNPNLDFKFKEDYEASPIHAKVKQ